MTETKGPSHGRPVSQTPAPTIPKSTSSHVLQITVQAAFEAMKSALESLMSDSVKHVTEDDVREYEKDDVQSAYVYGFQAPQRWIMQGFGDAAAYKPPLHGVEQK